MSRKVKPKMDEQVLADEKRAFELRLQGMSQHKIAEALNCSQQSVSIILRRVTEKYAKNFLSFVNEIKHMQVAQYENIAGEAMEAWYLSKKCPNQEKGFFGDPKYLTTFMEAKRDIRKVLGFDSVERELIEADLIGKIEIEYIGCMTDNKEVDPKNAEETSDKVDGTASEVPRASA